MGDHILLEVNILVFRTGHKKKFLWFLIRKGGGKDNKGGEKAGVLIRGVGKLTGGGGEGKQGEEGPRAKKFFTNPFFGRR